MRLKKVLGLLLGMTVAATMIGCGNGATDNQTEQTELQKVVLGTMPSADAVPYGIAKEMGFFEKNGLDVEIQTFTSAKDRDAAIQAGELDGMMMDLTGVSLLKGNGVPIKVVELTQGDFVVMASAESGITDIASLKGQVVGVSHNTLIELVTDLALSDNGLTVGDVIKEEIAATPVRMQLLMENGIQAATLPQSFAMSASMGGATKIASSADMGYQFGVLAFMEEVIDTKQDVIKAFNTAVDEAIEYINNNDLETYMDIVMAYTGYSEEAKEIIELPEYAPVALPSEKDITTALEWVKAKGLVPDTLAASDIVVETIIK